METLEDIPGLKTGVSLAPYNSWKLNATAEFFWEPKADLLPAVLKFCNEHQIETHIIGRGSNVLIVPDTLSGLTICTKNTLNKIERQNGQISAEAGVLMPTLSAFAKDIGYTGYEFLVGIPGTVGGGVAMNAGLASGGRQEIKDILKSVHLVNNEGEEKILRKQDLDFGFRKSRVLEEDDFVISASFRETEQTPKEEISATMAKILEERKSKQPLSVPTAGSTFKNPKTNEGPSAGWLIDECGFKGYQIGGARVSNLHANWIENVDGATSSDILKLIRVIQNKVYEEFNIELETEVRMLE